jgi:hypothetical protein
MKIKLLHTKGCPSTEKTLDLLRRVLDEEGVDETVELVRVENEDTAAQEGFLGSPSVQVDGTDIESSRKGDPPGGG